MGTQNAFRWVSIIAVGDLFQSLTTGYFRIQLTVMMLLQPTFGQSISHCLTSLKSWEGWHVICRTVKLIKRRKPYWKWHWNIEKKCAYNKTWSSKLPNHANHLFTTNELVNSHNNAVFHTTPTDKTQVKCIDLTVGDISDDLKKTMREKIPDDPVKIVHLHILKFRLLFFIVSLWSAYSRYDFWYYTRLLVSFCVDQSSVGT